MADSVHMNHFAIVPSPASNEGYLRLTRSTTGTLFEKHILSTGPLLYPSAPNGKVNIDEAFLDTLVSNFDGHVCDIVQFPEAGPKNEHTEAPSANLGEVVGLSKRDGKLYAQIDVREDTAIPKMGKTILGASALFHLNYSDTRTGKKMGPTLLHVAATNRPYVVDLEDYSQVIAASADGISDAVLLTAAPIEENRMSLDEILGELKADHGIDVPALQKIVADSASAVELSNSIRGALASNDFVTLSREEDLTTEVVVAALEEAATKIVSLTSQVDGMVKEAATTAAEVKVDGLIGTGHILPKTREHQIELFLTNPSLFESLLPEEPLIVLNREDGSEGGVALSRGTDGTEAESVDDVVNRVTSSPEMKAFVRA